ncbi:MAG: SGNH/GDSL hydrolase family protein [Rhizobiaceae bacterium]
MQTVLCYGDSLTWGYDADGPGRHAYADRWPSVLQAGLGDGVQVIADGLNGRTTVYDDHKAECDRNGARTLPTSLQTHSPLDLVILLLGTNDMKPEIAGNALLSMQGVRRLVTIIRHHPWPIPQTEPQVLIVSPPKLAITDDMEFTAMFAGAPQESAKLASMYTMLADEMGCAFFDAGTVANVTPVDGVHLDAANTRAVGEALVPVVGSMLKP